jgi:hypothetical protein
LKMFIAETHFHENFMGNENMRENFRETKFRENLLVFAFRENGKNRYRFNPTLDYKYDNYMYSIFFK